MFGREDGGRSVHAANYDGLTGRRRDGAPRLAQPTRSLNRHSAVFVYNIGSSVGQQTSK